jgi:hypothetical protein
MRMLVAVLAAVALVFTACEGSDPSGGGGSPDRLEIRLVSFSSCDEFLSYVKEHAVEQVTAWGLPGQSWGPWLQAGAPTAAAEDAVGGGEAPPAPTAGVDYSTTNLQTVGVDEPDIVKTDGTRMVALAQGKLFVLDVSGSSPTLLGSLTLDDVWVRDLVLVGDRVLLLGESGGVVMPVEADMVMPGSSGPISTLVEVDLSDPSAPRVDRRLLVDGTYLSARMIGGVARIVVSSYPTGLVFEGPQGPGLRAEREAVMRNQEIIRSSTIENWVPYYVLEDGAGGTLAEGSLLDCASANRPPEFAGFSMLTVLTVDLNEGLASFLPSESVGVLADGQTVYASTGSLYVATQRWFDWGVLESLGEDGLVEGTEGTVTQIHRFDISGQGAAVYRSSGEVPGWLLNQFSMDEHEGYLRVASTTAPPFWGGELESESRVTVLVENGDVLAEVGSVGGLGDGEQIYAVRFLGDLGYVVTFRQTDPLYVVDLSDPTAPAVRGELKILGYSAYLHPIGEDLLLGVGQDATQQGAVKGTQLSLFDVSDPASPRRVGQVQIADASSEAEWDHHAFLYWEPAGLVVVPMNVYRWDETSQTDESFYGAQAVRVAGSSLELLDRLSQEQGSPADYGYGIRRSVVIGDLLYTVSETGVEAVDLNTLADVAWVPFR